MAESLMDYAKQHPRITGAQCWFCAKVPDKILREAQARVNAGQVTCVQACGWMAKKLKIRIPLAHPDTQFGSHCRRGHRVFK